MKELARKQGQTEFRIPHLNGWMLKAPAYEEHFRGKNWLAIIDVDGAAPGGLARRFVPYGKGDSLYSTEPLALFDAVEFAADYTTTMGRTKPKRFFGVVTAITELEIIVREFDTGAEACVFAQSYRTSSQAKLNALEEERAALLVKAEKVEQEIAALRVT